MSISSTISRTYAPFDSCRNRMMETLVRFARIPARSAARSTFFWLNTTRTVYQDCRECGRLKRAAGGPFSTCKRPWCRERGLFSLYFVRKRNVGDNFVLTDWNVRDRVGLYRAFGCHVISKLVAIQRDGLTRLLKVDNPHERNS